jgi:hypothetical protein
LVEEHPPEGAGRGHFLPSTPDEREIRSWQRRQSAIAVDYLHARLQITAGLDRDSQSRLDGGAQALLARGGILYSCIHDRLKLHPGNPDRLGIDDLRDFAIS